MINHDFIDRIQKDFKHFVEAAEHFINSVSTDNKFSEVLKEGLKVFLKFENSISTSLFILDTSTFDFVHKITIPEKFEEHNLILFDELIDRGIVGITLQQRDISMNSEEINVDEYKNALTIPIIFNKGVYGLILLTLNERPEKINQIKLQFCRLFAKLYSNTLENSILSRDLKSKESVLEQIVAAKTLSLTQSKHELLAIFNSVQSGILIVDPMSKKITNANYMAKKLLGGSDKDIIGSYYNDFLQQSEEEYLSDKDIAFSRNFKSRLRNLQGIEIPVLRTFSNIYIANQKLRIESFVDITDQTENEEKLKRANELLELKVQERTEDLSILVLNLKNEINERKKAEKELLKTIEKEKELNDLKSRFVSMVTHEFKTPLTIISNAVQIVKDYKDKISPEEETKYLERMLSTVDFISHLLEKVVFIGKSDAERLSVIPKEINVFEFFNDIIQDIEMINSSVGRIVLSFNSKDVKFVTDEKLLRHILINLISNATKYSDPEQKIYIDYSCNSAVLKFVVKDSGIGIPFDEQEKVYDQFFRANNVGNISGTGLGMAIVIRSIELLDGNIELESQVDKGTKFTIRLKKLEETKS